jgi:hypothetical protein
MKTHLRENRLSATTRRRVINIIAARPSPAASTAHGDP